MGRYDDAVRELEKAVELKPGDPTINDHLGDAYWKVGRKVEAKFQWDHAKDLGSGARRAGEDPQEDRQRPGRGSEAGRRRERARSPAGGAEAQRRVGHAALSIMAGLVPAIFVVGTSFKNLSPLPEFGSKGFLTLKPSS